MLTVGLFGTCDNNPWRDPFMERYNSMNINYFNPMVDDWNPGMVAEEAKHLAEDEIVLFPILGWSYGVGSLAELGFGPLRAMRQNFHRSFVIYIEDELHERLTDPDRCKDSFNARKIVKGHLTKLNSPNIYIAKSLDNMMDISLSIHKSYSILKEVRDCS